MDVAMTATLGEREREREEEAQRLICYLSSTA